MTPFKTAYAAKLKQLVYIFRAFRGKNVRFWHIYLCIYHTQEMKDEKNQVPLLR